MKKTKRMLEIEARFGEDLEDLLRRMYAEKSATKISEELKVDDTIVRQWFKQYGIKIRFKNGIYNDKENRKKSIDELLEITGKKPGELTTNDFVIKKKDGISCGGILDWYRRTHKCKSVAAKDILISDLYGSGIEIINKRAIYNNKERRKKAIDELLEVTGKRPKELTTHDFRTKKKDGVSYIGVLGWYQRNHNCNRGTARNILVHDLYGSRSEIINKKGIYDDKELRRKTVDELLEITGKRPEELATSDFSIKKKDGISCCGVLAWYQRENECNFTEARNKLVWDLYEVRAKIGKRGLCDDKEYRKKCVEELLEKRGKKPEELNTQDFRIKNGNGVSYVGVLAWYMRKHDCKSVVAKDILVQDLYCIKNISAEEKLDKEKQQLEKLLEGYAASNQ